MSDQQSDRTYINFIRQVVTADEFTAFMSHLQRLTQADERSAWILQRYLEAKARSEGKPAPMDSEPDDESERLKEMREALKRQQEEEERKQRQAQRECWNKYTLKKVSPKRKFEAVEQESVGFHQSVKHAKRMLLKVKPLTPSKMVQREDGVKKAIIAFKLRFEALHREIEAVDEAEVDLKKLVCKVAAQRQNFDVYQAQKEELKLAQTRLRLAKAAGERIRKKLADDIAQTEEQEEEALSDLSDEEAQDIREFSL